MFQIKFFSDIHLHQNLYHIYYLIDRHWQGNWNYIFHCLPYIGTARGGWEAGRLIAGKLWDYSYVSNGRGKREFSPAYPHFLYEVNGLWEVSNSSLCLFIIILANKRYRDLRKLLSLKISPCSHCFPAQSAELYSQNIAWGRSSCFQNQPCEMFWKHTLLLWLYKQLDSSSFTDLGLPQQTMTTLVLALLASILTATFEILHAELSQYNATVDK